YLLAAKEKFGNWTLAAASYNGGMNGITRQIERQKVSDFYDLLLTEETFRYVFRILALKEIMQHRERYAYVIATNELYPPFTTQKITVDSPIENWADFAQQHNINNKTLKIHNPWLRDISLPNKAKKTYYS